MTNEDRKNYFQLEPSAQDTHHRAHCACRCIRIERLRKMVAMGSVGRIAPRWPLNYMSYVILSVAKNLAMGYVNDSLPASRHSQFTRTLCEIPHDARDDNVADL